MQWIEHWRSAGMEMSKVWSGSLIYKHDCYEWLGRQKQLCFMDSTDWSACQYLTTFLRVFLEFGNAIASPDGQSLVDVESRATVQLSNFCRRD